MGVVQGICVPGMNTTHPQQQYQSLNYFMGEK
jgi:hypothetical protein